MKQFFVRLFQERREISSLAKNPNLRTAIESLSTARM